MARKVTVVDGKGAVLDKWLVATEESFQRLLDKFNVTSLEDHEGFKVDEYASLSIAGGEYTLGETKTNGKKCFRFGCLLLNLFNLSPLSK